jgi:predicted dehydrogenase
MASGPVRVALIGYGLAGGVFHAPLIAATERLKLAAIVTADPDRRRQAGQRYPGVRLLDSPDDIWSNADEYGLVVIAAPNRAHAPLAERAIRSGLAVVVDKPLAATRRQADFLIGLASQLGVPLTVFQNRRWDGDYLTIKRLIDAGDLGAVLRFESRFERWRPELAGGWRERGDPAEAGGVLIDLGSHLVDQALQLFGPAAEVYGEVGRRRSDAEADDDSFIAITHRGGTISHLWMSSVAALAGPRFRVLGDRAGFVKTGLDPQEEALRTGGVPGRAGWGEDEPSNFGILGDNLANRTVPTAPGAYDEFYKRLAAALLDGAPMPVDPSDSRDVLAVLESARESKR